MPSTCSESDLEGPRMQEESSQVRKKKRKEQNKGTKDTLAKFINLKSTVFTRV